MPPFARRLTSTALTLAVAALAGWLCHLAGLPAPWILGGTVSIAALSLLRIGGEVPVPLFNASMVFLGASMGSSVSPAALARIGEWPASMAGLLVSVVAIMGVSMLCLRFIGRWDWNTALFASFPGAFVVVMTMSAEAKADTPRVVVAQVLRVFLLITAIPLVVSNVGHMDTIERIPVVGTPGDYALMVVLCIAGGIAAYKLRVPAGLLIGSFVVSAILHATETVTATLPETLQAAGFVVLSAAIGRRFAPIEPKALLGWLAPALMAFLAAFLVTAASAAVVGMLTDIPFAQLLIAYMPGVLEAMILLAFALGVDPVFVSAHQLARFLALMLIVPLIARWSRAKKDGAA